MIRVAVIEDSPDLNKTLALMINASNGLSCTSVHLNAEEACEVIPNDPPDIVLIDLGLPGMSGIECINKLKKSIPGLLFLVLTIKDQDEQIFGALKTGASGYLLKSATPSTIIESIKELYDGGAPMSTDIARKVVRYFRQGKKAKSSYEQLLTKREREVLQLLAEGKFYKEIASKLFISIETVKSHCHNIYEKLHVSTRTEAINKYFDRY